MSRAESRRKGGRRRGLFSVVRWALGSVLFVGVEACLLTQVKPHDPRSGWLIHFFIGISVGLIAMTVWLVEERRRVPLPILWILTGHLLAIFPDLLFAGGNAHRHWMDAFLGHLISHQIPAANMVSYLVFLVALGSYLALDARIRSQSRGGRRRRQA